MLVSTRPGPGGFLFHSFVSFAMSITVGNTNQNSLRHRQDPVLIVDSHAWRHGLHLLFPRAVNSYGISGNNGHFQDKIMAQTDLGEENLERNGMASHFR